MSKLDTIAEFLTRLRNANSIKAKDVRVPYSKLKWNICNVLKVNGYIKDFKEEKLENNKSDIVIILKYSENGDKVIHGIKQISKQGCRIYVSKTDIPYVMGGYGIAVLTTSKGVMCDKKAREEGVGGEVICYVW
ncbi:MAG TPA: 30S ribosomal protein S8 [bacterium]|nr:30S ribosomal protein S8 [bacterium]HPP86854.1 30S ribosomal protein S8 [bacterium]